MPADALPAGVDVAVVVNAAVRDARRRPRSDALECPTEGARAPLGGEGSRLRPLTHTNAKQLIPWRTSRSCSTCSRRSATPGSPRSGSWSARPPTRSGPRSATASAWGLRVTYIRRRRRSASRTPSSWRATSSRGEPFVMYLGDNVAARGHRAGSSRSSNAPARRADLPGEGPRAGAVRRGGARRRPGGPPGGEAEGARLRSRARRRVPVRRPILEACDTLEPSWRGELEITEAIQGSSITGGTVRAEMVSGWWKDTGRPEDLLEANRMMLSVSSRRSRARWTGLDARRRRGGRAGGEGHALARSSARAIVGADALVEDSTSGRTSRDRAGVRHHVGARSRTRS